MKIVFYTCATGPEDGFIPDIRGLVPEGLECYFLHDNHLKSEATENRGWKYINLDEVDGCPTNFGTKQRFGKLLPHRHFPDADRTIYLDNKWHLTRAALEALLRFTLNHDGDCFVPRHPDNRTLAQELMWPFAGGPWSFDETVRTAEAIKTYGLNPENFCSVLATLLIRKNNEIVNAANEKWYWFVENTYSGSVRDQPFFCYSGMPFTLIDPPNGTLQFEFGCRFQYGPTTRWSGQPEIERAEELWLKLNETLSSP